MLPPSAGLALAAIVYTIGLKLATKVLLPDTVNVYWAFDETTEPFSVQFANV